MKIETVIRLLLERAQNARSLCGDCSAAHAYEQAAEVVRSEAANYNRGLLTLSEAALESGYSTDHLRRLLRAKRLLNYGRKGQPLIQRNDLPRKPNMETVSLS